MSENKIIIIEDDFNDFKAIRKNIDFFCNCYPDVGDNSRKFSSFVSLFQRSLDSNETINIKKNMKNSLLSKLRGIGDNVYFIVDFALQEHDTENITGLKFYETIINKLYPNLYTPTLILTGINFDDDISNSINNKLMKYRDKINDEAGSKVFEYLRKDFKNQKFNEYIIQFVKDTSSKPRQSEISAFEIIITKLKTICHFPDCVKDNGKSLFNFLDKLLDKKENLKNNEKLLENLRNFSTPYEKDKIEEFIDENSKYLKS